MLRIMHNAANAAVVVGERGNTRHPQSQQNDAFLVNHGVSMRNSPSETFQRKTQACIKRKKSE
jgi:hypothetical protein